MSAEATASEGSGDIFSSGYEQYTFAELQQRSEALLANYFHLTSEAQAARRKEYFSAVSIQRAWRRHRERVYDNYVRKSAVHIQRVWRGHVGRRRAREAKRRKLLVLEQAYFDSLAVLIQKTVRGYLSRKHIQDFRKRRDFLRQVDQQASRLEAEAEEHARQQQAQHEAAKQEQDAEAFDRLTQNLHHLVSTKAIPGVFKSPYGEEFHATAFGVPVDDHLKEAFQNRQARLRLAKTQSKTKRADQWMDQKESDQATSQNWAVTSPVAARPLSSTRRPVAVPQITSFNSAGQAVASAPPPGPSSGRMTPSRVLQEARNDLAAEQQRSMGSRPTSAQLSARNNGTTLPDVHAKRPTQSIISPLSPQATIPRPVAPSPNVASGGKKRRTWQLQSPPNDRFRNLG